MTDHTDGGLGLKGFLKRNAVDIRPLQQVPAFRNLWSGEVITNIGAEITGPALLIQVATLTNSPLAAGLIGAVQLIPLIFGTIIGGPLIDRVDRRRLLVITELCLAGTSLVLMIASLQEHPPIWLLYLMGGIASFVWGIDLPTRSSITPNLVGEELLPAAVSLNFLMWSIAMIFGPMLAGLAIAIGGPALAYGLDLVTFGIALILILRIPPQPVQNAIPVDPEQGNVTWAAIKEGFRYLKGRRVLVSTFTVDLSAMIFGLPEALFPILAITQFNLSEEAAALMFTALALGSLIATLTDGWINRITHQGKAVVIAVVLWGAAIVGFGLIGSHFALGLLFLAIAGGADAISAVFRGTILQSTVPDNLRGRMSSLHFMVVAGGPKLGYLESGLVAAMFNPLVAVVSGGVLCIAGAVTNAVLVPEFWTYHAGDDTAGEPR